VSNEPGELYDMDADLSDAALIIQMTEDGVSMGTPSGFASVDKATKCMVCGKPLSSPQSVKRGIGPSHIGPGGFLKTDAVIQLEARGGNLDDAYKAINANPLSSEEHKPTDGADVNVDSTLSLMDADKASGMTTMGVLDSWMSLVEGNTDEDWTKKMGEVFEYWHGSQPAEFDGDGKPLDSYGVDVDSILNAMTNEKMEGGMSNSDVVDAWATEINNGTKNDAFKKKMLEVVTFWNGLFEDEEDEDDDDNNGYGDDYESGYDEFGNRIQFDEELDQILKDHYLVWANGLTPETKPAVTTYQSSGYRQINGYLRGTTPDRPHSGYSMIGEDRVPDYVSHLDAMMAQNKTPENVVVYRSMSNVFDLEVGKTFRDDGFTSTTISPAFAEDWNGGVFLEINVPPGTPSLYLDANRSVNEYELLLARGFEYKVVGVGNRDRPNRRHFIVEIAKIPEATPPLPGGSLVDKKTVSLTSKLFGKSDKPDKFDKFTWQAEDVVFLDDEETEDE